MLDPIAALHNDDAFWEFIIPQIENKLSWMAEDPVTFTVAVDGTVRDPAGNVVGGHARVGLAQEQNNE